MKKTLLLSILMLMGFAASAQFRVDPPEGRVNLSPNLNYLGLKQITIYGTSTLELNPNRTGDFCIYYEDLETPVETKPATAATIDVETLMSCTIFFDGDYTRPGTYRVTIPAGVFTQGDTPNPAMDLRYYIINDYTLTPADGSVVTSLQEWYVEATEAQEIECRIPPIIAMRGDATEYQLHTEVIREDGVNPNRLRMWVDEPLTTPGVWLLQIDEGAFRFTTYGPNYANDPKDVTVTTSNESRPMYYIATTPKLEITPAEGNIESIYDFTFQMPEGFSMVTVDTMWKSKFYEVDADGDNIRDVADLKFFTFGQPVLTICDKQGLKLNDPISLEPGRYCLKLADAAFFGSYNGKNVNTSPFAYYYNVPLKVFDATIDPADGATLPRIDAFTMSFDKAEYLSVNEAEGAPVAYIEKDGEKLANSVKLAVDGGISPQSAENPLNVAVTVEPAIVEKGNYRLVIPEGCLLSGNDLSPEYAYTYICDGSQGVEGIDAEAQTYDIYTVTGIAVARGVDAAYVGNLPEGLYIINGQKVLVRK